MNIQEELYNASSGKFTLPGYRKGAGAFDEGGSVRTTVEAVTHYATQGARDTENNAIYDTMQRMRRTAAVVSLFAGANYEESRAQNTYQSIDFNSTKMQKQMDMLGYGTTQQQKANTLLTGASFNVQGKTLSTQHLDALKNIALSNQQMLQIEKTGSFKLSAAQVDYLQKQIPTDRTGNPINLKEENICISSWGDGTTPGINAPKAQDQLRLAREERERRETIIGRTGRKGQNEAMRNFRSAQISFLSSRGGALQGFTGNESRRKLNEIETELQSQLNDAIQKGDSTRASELQDDLDIFQDFRDTGNKADSSGRGNRKRSYGRSIVNQNVMGSDFYQGVKFYQRSAKVTRDVTRAAFHGSLSAGSTIGAGIATQVGNVAARHGNTSLKNRAELVKDDIVKFHGENAKIFREGRDPKQARAGRRSRRRERQQKRFEKKQAKFNRDITALKAKGNRGPLTAEDSRKLRSLEKKQRKSDRGQKRRADFADSKMSFAKFRKNIGARVDALKNTKFMQFVNLPHKAASAIGDVFRKAKSTIIKYATMLGVGGLLVIIIVATINGFASAIFAFFASDSLLDSLNEVNYVQLIVDQTAETLGGQYQTVAKRDAYIHYLNAPSSEYEADAPIEGWSMTVREPKIDQVTSSQFQNENGEWVSVELPSVNANLLPICSLMHARYNDSINFDNYYTALGYTYYMYTQSHHEVTYEYDKDGNVLLDDDGNPVAAEGSYSYEIEPPHENSELYKDETKTFYDAEKNAVTRGGEELCDNIYIHGYDKNWSVTYNKVRSSINDFLNRCIAEVNTMLETDIPILDQYGIMTEEQKDEYGCDHYLIKGKLNCKHVHTDDCKKLICTVEEHTHTDACYTKVLTCKNTSKKHKHTAKCFSRGTLTCTKTEHTHSDSCYDYSGCKHVHDEMTFSTDGKSVVDAGCYEPVYICLGHCGGHITPTINVTVDYDWESLCKLDAYKTTYFLTKAEIFEDAVQEDAIIGIEDAALKVAEVFGATGLFKDTNSILQWQEFWNKKCSAWFSPCPRSFVQVYASAIDMRIKFFVHAEDWVHKHIQKAMGLSSDVSSSDSDIKDEMEAASSEVKDIYGWNGWFLDDQETIDPGQLSTLQSLYGVPTDNYSMGQQMWENFNVTFPIGTGKPLTTEQKGEILAQVQKAWKDEYGTELPATRQAVIEEAMDKVGLYSYSLTGRGHQNGLQLDSYGGVSDCSGFVGGVIRRSYVSLGHDIESLRDSKTENFTGSAASYCHSKKSPKPGDIIAHNNGGNNYTGHVLIYIGHLDGIDGYSIIDDKGNSSPQTGAGEYVIHCTSHKGSVLQKIGGTTNYPYTYTPSFY